MRHARAPSPGPVPAASPQVDQRDFSPESERGRERPSFLDSRRRHAPLKPRAHPRVEEADSLRAEQLEHWRAAARQVGHAWDIWLASDEAERDWAHEVYLEALSREEQAASLLEDHSRALHRRYLVGSPHGLAR